jgi:hypothetical protein
MATIYRTPNIISMVRSRSRQISTAALTDQQVLTMLDEAQLELCAALNDAALWALGEVQTAALTLDELPYALPADFLRERHVQYKTIAAMRAQVHELSAYLGYDAMRTPSETNPFYYLWNNALYLLAGTKTAGNYSLYYFKTPAALTTSTNPALGKEYDDLLEIWAVMRIAESLGDTGLAEELWQEFGGRVAIINSRATAARPYDTVPGDRRGA